MSCFCSFVNSQAISEDLMVSLCLYFILRSQIWPDVSAQLSKLFLAKDS